MHVRPSKQHGYRWTDEAKRYFNWTASGDLGDRLPEESSYEMSATSEGQQWTKSLAVSILRLVDPGELYVTLGKPSYVDNNGVIYLEQEPVLNTLRKVINAKFVDSNATDKFYLENEPCMAKFHQDNTFYRAIDRKAISCRRYKVQFIDYGKIEVVDIADLRKNVNCGRVPIQMTTTTGAKLPWAADMLQSRFLPRLIAVPTRICAVPSSNHPATNQLAELR
ncbi:hypothetical protein quinque_002762 [Culex quinquefasciatus]